MGTLIKILPEALANQIAAGEVVERPSSVVKELVENSIDAGASEIIVEIENGGKRMVRVTDDGCGMNHDDAFLCLERHATSKIASEGDLFALQSMGFRGEALPAIASVCRFRLQTRSVDEENGWQIYAEGGVIRQAEAVGGPSGTVIEVRNLFFNTPARRKFLRRDETEFGHIADVVSRLAMCRPDIHFKLIHGGRTHLEAFRHQKLEERVAALLSRTMAAEMRSLEADSGSGEIVTGLLGLPSLSRSNGNHIYTYVNGRFVRDRVVQHAVLEAYRTLLEKRRYPVVVLFLDLPPEQVDVNVHPTKHEVRFREQGRVHDFLLHAIRNCLRSHLSGEPQRVSDTRPASAPLHHQDEDVRTSPETIARASVQESFSAYQQQTPVSWSPSRKGEAIDFVPSVQSPKVSPVISGWRLIGQYLGSYLLCQVGDDLLVVDQHAAHERIGFERLKAQFTDAGIEQQELLLPVVVDLDHREAAAITQQIETLERLGFRVESFGGRSFAVKSVPQLLVDADIERLLRDLAGELSETGRTTILEEAFDEVLTLMACHGMIRANQDLSRSEMDALLKDLAEIDFGSHCPHGRPVVWRLGKNDVERMFHRR